MASLALPDMNEMRGLIAFHAILSGANGHIGSDGGAHEGPLRQCARAGERDAP